MSLVTVRYMLIITMVLSFLSVQCDSERVREGGRRGGRAVVGVKGEADVGEAEAEAERRGCRRNCWRGSRSGGRRGGSGFQKCYHKGCQRGLNVRLKGWCERVVRNAVAAAGGAAKGGRSTPEGLSGAGGGVVGWCGGANSRCDNGVTFFFFFSRFELTCALAEVECCCLQQWR
ncbi:hypothetical protein BDZ91DRAFT_164780 [Kalaharituber pfeilii]|nr:hypothetical protein BDZ91DRAFT_164780 [Kalaharituber pfeilii]